MHEEACGYGVKSGVTLPIHGTKGELGIVCFVGFGDRMGIERYVTVTTPSIERMMRRAGLAVIRTAHP